jgi:hypothetical protein
MTPVAGMNRPVNSSEALAMTLRRTQDDKVVAEVTLNSVDWL